MPTLRRFFCCGPCGSFDEDVKKLTSKEEELIPVVNRAKRRGEADEAEREWVDKAETILVDAKLLKNEINENKDCSKRFQLSDSLEKMITAIDWKLREANKLKGPSAFDPAAEQPDDSYLIPSESSKRAIDQIMQALIDEDISVVELYGIGGVGKTTVARQLGKKAEESLLFNKVVMVKATTEESYPDPRLIQTRIAGLLGCKFDEEIEDRNARLEKEIQKVDKILIILDDVWKEPDLEAIGIPFGEAHKGCKILLTTRRLSVCTSIRSHKTIQLDHLSKPESLQLFRLCSELNSDASNLERQEKVVEAWDGLPLAIVTMGNKLKGNPHHGLTAAEEELMIPQDSPKCFYEDIYRQLKLSYDYLNDKKTKSCFLLCSLFPKDYTIRTEELMRMASGLGLFDNDENVNFIEDARKQARQAISNLQSSLLFAQAKGHDVRMGADFFRGFAHWIAPQEGQRFLAGANLADSNKVETINWFNSYTAISLLKYQLNVISDGDHVDCSNLETLVIFTDPPYLIKYTTSFFQGMNNLKVLSLLGRSSSSVITLSSLSVEGLALLTNLRVMRFQRYKIYKLGRLPSLKILAFIECEIHLLPEEFGDLNGTLKLLDLSRCQGLQNQLPIAQNLLERLSELEELYIDIDFDKKSSVVLSELKSLEKLALISLKVPKEYGPDFVVPRFKRDDDDDRTARYAIEINVGDEGFDRQIPTSRAVRVKKFPLNSFRVLFKDVEHLYLDTIDGCTNLIPSLDEQLKELKYLKLNHCSSMECLVEITTNPQPAEIEVTEESWNIGVFSNVTKIELESLKELSCLWKGEVRLENLKVMRITGCDNLEGHLFSVSIAQGPKKLEELDIKSCPKLGRIFKDVQSSDKVSFPELKSVKIADCNGLQSIFPTAMAEGLPQLRELDITGCPELEHVFTASDPSTNHEMHDVEDSKLKLPSLQRLVLKKLDGMKSVCFCREFIVAPLEEFEVEECPLLEPFAIELKEGMPAPMEKLRLGEVGSRVENRDKDRITRLKERSPESQRFIVGNLKVAFQHQCGYFFSRLKELELTNATQVQVIWEDRNQISGLQNLSSLKLVGCDKLKYIFTLILARNLPRLKHLSIVECDGLEHIIHADQSSMLQQERETNSKNEVLPQLQELTLIDLKELFSITPAGYHFVFSSLRKMTIKKCPKTKTSFTEDARGIVHAETKVQLDQEGRGNSEESTASSSTIHKIKWKEGEGGNLTWRQGNTQTIG